MSLAKRQLSCEVCGATETAAIRDGAATGYVLCDDCNACVVDGENAR
jgi:hypothetical protein